MIGASENPEELAIHVGYTRPELFLSRTRSPVSPFDDRRKERRGTQRYNTNYTIQRPTNRICLSSIFIKIAAKVLVFHFFFSIFSRSNMSDLFLKITPHAQVIRKGEKILYLYNITVQPPVIVLKPNFNQEVTKFEKISPKAQVKSV